jgi:MFS family permease
METIRETPTHTGTAEPPSASEHRPPVAPRIATSVLFLVNGALFGAWVSRIPAIETQRSLTHGTLGLALLALASGALVAMPLAGRFSARFGSHRVCRVTTLACGCFLPLLALAPNFTLLVSALFCFGANHGALDVAMNAQAVLVEKRYRRPIMSSFHALFSIGGLTGAAVGGWLAALQLTPFAHFTGMALVLTALAIVAAFPFLLDDRETGTPDSTPRPPFALPAKPVLIIGAIAFASMLGEGAMADWTAVFLRDTLGSSEALAATAYAAFSVTMAVMRVFGDRLTMRFGPVGLARLSGSVVAAGMSLSLLSTSPGLAMAGFALVGAGFATIVPLAFSAAGRLPGIAPGMALASTTTIGYLGFLIGPPLIGFAAELLGLRGALTLVVATGVCIVALAGALRHPSECPPA